MDAYIILPNSQKSPPQESQLILLYESLKIMRFDGLLEWLGSPLRFSGEVKSISRV